VLRAALATNSPINALDVLEAALATFPQSSSFSLETSTAMQKRHHGSLKWSNTTSDVSKLASGTDQCTTTFHRTPTQACTETHYASTTTFPVNCYGCVGEHALPSSAYDENSVSHLFLISGTNT
jgi:hypothetical protein